MKNFISLIMLISLISCKKEVNTFYQIISIDDKISKIKWGNNEFTNSQDFKTDFLNKDYLFTEDKNKDFIVIRRAITRTKNVGIIMPLKKNAKIILVNNLLTFDSENSIIAVENLTKNKNPILLKNLKNGKLLLLGSDLPLCNEKEKLGCFHVYGGIHNKKFNFMWTQQTWGLDFTKHSYDISSILE